jgi:hypothetical protein
MRAFCCSSLGSQKDLFGENISEPKEEQQNELFGETYQRA